MGYDHTALEKKWQAYWAANRSFRALEPADAGDRPKAYILDMFPYPSGQGLHVGHVENYAASDIVARHKRMLGFNVLHPFGWDAFGLPAEQYAIKTNHHPRQLTARSIDRFRTQIQSLGMSYDWDREIDTTDPSYYRWTQWIFLRLFNSYFDPVSQQAKPIDHLMTQLLNENLVVAPDGSVHLNPIQEGMEAIAGRPEMLRVWGEVPPEEQRQVIDGLRLAYIDEVPVNWCPSLGTVLANEEVIDGKSEVGGFPVERRPMRQWMLRITAYADRLLNDLSLLSWPESLKEMQRNWIGRSDGAMVDFEIAGAAGDADASVITVFTTRPDTLYGATYMVLAPEHPLVDRLLTDAQRADVDRYRAQVAGRSERDRIADAKTKTGVFTGGYAVNPVNDDPVPVWIADYVLMGYGTGAIMAVPAHDQRDFDFATAFGIPIKTVVARPGETPDGRPTQAFEDEGIAVNSPLIDGLSTTHAKKEITQWLEHGGLGRGQVQYKLRDWLFSRQRYWGEPFPIVLDGQGNPRPLDDSELPLVLPEMDDFRPTGTPEPPLSKAAEWVRYTPPANATGVPGITYTRETNTMPQWAGSSWYYLRYLDPTNADALVDPAKERYWMPVDVYIGGVEHAVLHLLYSRFWHKVLFDLGVVSTPEPFARLVNQGLILGEVEYHVFESPDAKPVSAAEVCEVGEEATSEGVRMIATHSATGQPLVGRRLTEQDVERNPGGYSLKSDPTIRVDARSFKMSKSRGNVANPDDLIVEHGADALRLYVMYLGPLEAQKPWNTRDIIGMTRFLNGVWRNLVGDEERGTSAKLVAGTGPDALDRLMHRTIRKVGQDLDHLRFNTAIAELIKLNNELTGMKEIPRTVAENLVLMLAPLAPHLSEELWERLGHNASLIAHPWPDHDAAKLVDDRIELPVQVNGKLRDKITVPADADQAAVLATAAAAEKVRPWLDGKDVKKRIYVKGKLVSFVVAD